MICQFSFRNYKSYRKETTFDFQAAAIPEFAESLLTCKAENKYILSGLHRDILAGIKEPDSEPIDKVFKITIQDDERTSEVSFEEWLDRHPFEKIAFMKAKDVRRKYKKSRPPCGSFEQWLDMHPYEKEIYDRAERIRRKYKKDCVLRRREKECALHRKEVH